MPRISAITDLLARLLLVGLVLVCCIEFNSKEICLKIERTSHTSYGQVTSTTDFDPERAQVAITTLTDYRDNITKLDAEVLGNIEDDNEADNEVDTAADFDALILRTIATVSAKLNTANSVRSNNDVTENSQSIHQSVSSLNLSGHKKPSVKLPKLEIEKYYGDPLSWAEFWDSFTSTIHENEDLSDVDKFKYLRTLVGGDALTQVAGYNLTSANYATAVEDLKDKFGNTELAIFAHFESMLSLPTATNHDIKQLQNIFDECEKHIRSLVALGLPEETFGRVFIPIILSKMPTFVKMEMHRKNGSNPWELSNLRVWLREELRARDYSQRVFGNGAKNGQSSGQKFSDRRNFHSKKQNSGPHGTTSALVTNEKQSSPRCNFCNESHYSDKCQKFPDAASRKQQATESRMCFKCLSTKHTARQCDKEKPCFYCKRTGHHSSFCLSKFGSKKPQTTQSTSLNVENDTVADTPVHKTAQLIAHGERAILQTAIAKIQNKNGTLSSARLLFDTGCTRTFITTKLSDKIQSRPQQAEVIAIAGFAETVRKTVKYKTIELDILTPSGGSKTITANVTPTISCPIQKQPLDVASNPVIHQLQLAEPLCSSSEMVEIDILVGTDYYYDFIGSEQIRMNNGIIFLSSCLGFIATGKMKCGSAVSKKGSALFMSRTESYPDSTFHVEKFWSLEDIGVKDKIRSTDDDDAVKSLKNSIKFKDGRYYVDWPWKEESKDLPDNYGLALGRLKSLKRRIDSSPEVLKLYDKTIQDQLSKEIIEEVPNKETDNKVHYIPHHCVITPNKTTTKLRIVYDASAKCSKQSVSMNECLNRGPVILADLCGLLMRFRLKKIGIVSDIEKAFLQVGLHERSRDVTRFIWLKDPFGPVSKENLIEYRFARVPFGFISSPFLLSGTIEHHIEVSENPVTKDLDDSFYVDNLIDCEDDLEASKSFYVNSKKLFNDASMNLREWFTNSSELKDTFADSDRGNGDTTKVLGLNWNTSNDSLATSSFNIQKDAVTTKRLMLSNLAKVFDPCGYFAAVTVSGKILIQKLWKDQYGWDEKLPDAITQQWEECASDLEQIGNFEFPRCILPKHVTTNSVFSLHCFVDASAAAYAANVYLVSQDCHSTAASLIFAKSRVAPLKEMTIPKLELMAMVIGVRITEFVAEQLKIAKVSIEETVVWSDSQCVLFWLSKLSLDGKFVKNRVEEIKKHKDFKFRYVPTAQNPSDLSSRGCSFSHIVNSTLWWHGPDWLVKSKSTWPKDVVRKTPLHEAGEKSEILVTDRLDVEKSTEASVIDIARFSSLLKLLRVTALVFRFAKKRSSGDIQKGPLKAEELVDARKYWERTTQQTRFEDTLARLKSNKPDYTFKEFDLFLDNDNIIRCRGRLDNADIPDDSKWPILLPKNSIFTDLVIDNIHQQYHKGPTQTLSNVRLTYWIVHGRNQVKRVLKNCRHCRYLYGGPFMYPKSPSIPRDRVIIQKPFECIGVDYMGPLYVKKNHRNSDVGTTKVWICLFTCTTIRAVHLDVVTDLSAQQFVLCLRRFIASIGLPRLIISDNGKQFTAADRFLSTLSRSNTVQDFASSKGISWQFITERSPWMGGFYERMVGIVKKALKSTLDRRCATFVELQTIIADVCSVVNSRPITTVGSDPDALALTPAHFIKGDCLSQSFFPDVRQTTTQKVPNNDSLVATWKRIQAVTNNFWKTWQHQYLQSLRNTFSFSNRNASNIRPEVGVVVIVKDNLPRCQWRLGKITSLKHSTDGEIRTAQIQLSNGNTISRSLRHLFPLEVPAGSGNAPQTHSVDNDDTSSQVSTELLNC